MTANKPNQINPFQKVAIIGDKQAGKTALVNRLNNKPFPEKHEATVYFDSTTDKLQNENNQQLSITYWDTAGGKETLMNPKKQPIDGADQIILVYDKTNQKTFDRLRADMADIKQYQNRNKPPRIVLVSTHEDEPNACVTDAMAQSFMDEFHIEDFHKVSSKDGQGIENLKEDITHYAWNKESKKQQQRAIDTLKIEAKNADGEEFEQINRMLGVLTSIYATDDNNTSRKPMYFKMDDSLNQLENAQEFLKCNSHPNRYERILSAINNFFSWVSDSIADLLKQRSNSKENPNITSQALINKTQTMRASVQGTRTVHESKPDTSIKSDNQDPTNDKLSHN